eukprot:m.48481 g.48481  ORF g.48481 m.48481 type:complete len:369 (-) comp10833_c1_seq6:94-1200(-)
MISFTSVNSSLSFYSHAKCFHSLFVCVFALLFFFFLCLFVTLVNFPQRKQVGDLMMDLICVAANPSHEYNPVFNTNKDFEDVKRFVESNEKYSSEDVILYVFYSIATTYVNKCSEASAGKDTDPIFEHTMFLIYLLRRLKDIDDNERIEGLNEPRHYQGSQAVRKLLDASKRVLEGKLGFPLGTRGMSLYLEEMVFCFHLFIKFPFLSGYIVPTPQSPDEDYEDTIGYDSSAEPHLFSNYVRMFVLCACSSYYSSSMANPKCVYELLTIIQFALKEERFAPKVTVLFNMIEPIFLTVGYYLHHLYGTHIYTLLVDCIKTMDEVVTSGNFIPHVINRTGLVNLKRWLKKGLQVPRGCIDNLVSTHRDYC